MTARWETGTRTGTLPILAVSLERWPRKVRWVHFDPGLGSPAVLGSLYQYPYCPIAPGQLQGSMPPSVRTCTSTAPLMRKFQSRELPQPSSLVPVLGRRQLQSQQRGEPKKAVAGARYHAYPGGPRYRCQIRVGIFWGGCYLRATLVPKIRYRESIFSGRECTCPDSSFSVPRTSHSYILCT